MLTLLLRHLLIVFHRGAYPQTCTKNEYLDHEMDTAASYFNENYNRDINIEEYAVSRGMSVSWFIPEFQKKFTGTTPNAVSSPPSESLMPKCYARIVGYDNPLYFSRLFQN